MTYNNNNNNDPLSCLPSETLALAANQGSTNHDMVALAYV